MKTPFDPESFQKLISFIPTSPIFLRKISDVLFVRAGLVPVQADSRQRSRNSEEQKCHICIERKPDIVIMHCGHGGVCFICAIIFVQVDLRCYMCRHQIDCILQVEQQQSNSDCVKVSNVFILDCEQPDETMQRVITELNHCEEEKEKEEKKSTQDLHKEIEGNIINEQTNCNNFCENDLNNTSNPEICTNNNSSLSYQSQHKHGFCNFEVSQLTSFDKVEVISKEESKSETHK